MHAMHRHGEQRTEYSVRRDQYIRFVIAGMNIHPVFDRGKCLVEASWSYRVALASFEIGGL